MKIVVDVFGGDHAPGEILKGCADALIKDKDFNLILTGDEKTVREGLENLKADLSRVEIIHAPEIITNDESPTEAIRKKKDSSLVRAFDALKEDPDAAGMISAGSTGAVLTGGLLKIGRIKGIARPALAPVLPTLDGGNVALVDCGANMDCKPHYLAQFALMGVAYMRSMYGIKDPRVALVSVGTEDKKGNEQSKAAFQLLKQMPINFVGNMEARDCLSGNYDVLVADGYVGNVCLKSMEGTMKGLMKLMKEAMFTNLKTKIGATLLKKELNAKIGRMDYTKGGGAAFVGVEKLLVKNHGSAKAATVCGSILQVKALAKGGLVDGIRRELENMPELTSEPTGE